VISGSTGRSPKGSQQVLHWHEQVQVVIFEPSEAALSIEGHRIPVESVHHHDLEADVAGSLFDLPQCMDKQFRAGTATLETTIDCEAR
jgi:hypothetical protein